MVEKCGVRKHPMHVRSQVRMEDRPQTDPGGA